MTQQEAGAIRSLAEVAEALGSPVQCGTCGSRSWLVLRVDQYQAVGTTAEGADGIMVCGTCSETVTRTDGKIADPEARLSG